MGSLLVRRYLSIDVLRILACFLVVCIHTIPINFSNESQPLLSTSSHAIARVGLPIFFVISGTFSLNFPILHVRKWRFNRIISLVIPFTIFSCLHFWYEWRGPLFSVHLVSSSIKNITTYLVGISMQYWYVYEIFALYTVAPIFNILINSIVEAEALHILKIPVSLSIFNVCSYLIEKATNLNFPFYSKGISIWLLCFLCGGFIYKCQKVLSIWHVVILVVLRFTLKIATSYLSMNLKFNFKPWDADNPLMLSYSMGLFVFFQKFPIQKIIFREEIVKFKLNLAKFTYGVYLNNISIFRLLNNIFRNFLKGTLGNNLDILIAFCCFFLRFIEAVAMQVPTDLVEKKLKLNVP